MEPPPGASFSSSSASSSASESSSYNIHARPPGHSPATALQNAQNGLCRPRTDRVSLLRKPHHHGDHPGPRGPHLAAVHRPLYVWVLPGLLLLPLLHGELDGREALVPRVPAGALPLRPPVNAHRINVHCGTPACPRVLPGHLLAQRGAGSPLSPRGWGRAQSRCSTGTGQMNESCRVGGGGGEGPPTASLSGSLLL
ncbi:LITAF domain-containing protein isoform X4 [Hyaena hyaena]|uniref:LITAF domain-containing protein isoform X4 n=1 Tax=Hyaena hyaena TaxID=95912 RepID=UPI001921DF88|nr:LITAF domain-containing protein isoform X4 [Hyaena hyaena]